MCVCGVYIYTATDKRRTNQEKGERTPVNRLGRKANELKNKANELFCEINETDASAVIFQNTKTEDIKPSVRGITF